MLCRGLNVIDGSSAELIGFAVKIMIEIEDVIWRRKHVSHPSAPIAVCSQLGRYSRDLYRYEQCEVHCESVEELLRALR